VVAVTGASSGIGAATAVACAEAGAKVALGARRTERIEELAARIKADGGEAMAVTVDIADEQQVSRFVDAICDRFGRIDALVNNAAHGGSGAFSQGPRGAWRPTVDTNVTGTILCTEAVLPVMQAQGSGHIVNVSSVSGHRALAGVGVYSATKHAVNGFTEALRQDLAGTGIRVTLIEPGTVLSEMTEKVLRERGTPPSATVPPRALADAIVFALTQPDSVNVAVMTVLPAADSRPW